MISRRSKRGHSPVICLAAAGHYRGQCLLLITVLQLAREIFPDKFPTRMKLFCKQTRDENNNQKIQYGVHGQIPGISSSVLVGYFIRQIQQTDLYGRISRYNIYIKIYLV